MSTFACSFSDHLLTIRLKPNLKHVCFFQSHFLWPKTKKKQLTVPDSLNFIFPLWEPHSRIIFLSQTNELQRVHYVASSKQEAGVSDGKGWFYIMRDAWGCTHHPARCRKSLTGSAPSNPGGFVQLAQPHPQTWMIRLLSQEKCRPPRLAQGPLAEELR